MTLLAKVNTLQVKEQHSGALFQEKELFSANSFAFSGIMRIFAADKTRFEYGKQ